MQRRVLSVEPVAGRGEVDVYLREDGDDLKMQTTPAAHLAYIALMKRDGSELEDEPALRARLMRRIGREGDGGPVDTDGPLAPRNDVSAA